MTGCSEATIAHISRAKALANTVPRKIVFLRNKALFFVRRWRVQNGNGRLACRRWRLPGIESQFSVEVVSIAHSLTLDIMIEARLSEFCREEDGSVSRAVGGS